MILLEVMVLSNLALITIYALDTIKEIHAKG